MGYRFCISVSFVNIIGWYCGQYVPQRNPLASAMASSSGILCVTLGCPPKTAAEQPSMVVLANVIKGVLPH